MIKQLGEDSSKKSVLLNELTATNEELIEALEQQEEYKLKMSGFEMEDRYNQSSTEELQSLLKVWIVFLIVLNSVFLVIEVKICMHKDWTKKFLTSSLKK